MTETILSIFSIYGAPALFVIVAAGQFGIPLPTSILLASCLCEWCGQPIFGVLT